MTNPVDSNITLLAQNMTISGDCDSLYSNNDVINGNNIEIPIVGYEIMEERARFTVSTKFRIFNSILIIFGWFYLMILL